MEEKQTNLEKSLEMLEDIVLTAETIEYLRQNKTKQEFIDKELDKLTLQTKEWRCFGGGCPKCGCEDTWFDRTIYLHPDGTEDGMKTRCVKCGEILY